jgi:uncharacterized protein with PIN domain
MLRDRDLATRRCRECNEELSSETCTIPSFEVVERKKDEQEQLLN